MSHFKEISEDAFKMNENELMEYHGYSGFTGRIKLRTNYIRSWILHSLAFSSTHSGFAIKMQKLRGVKEISQAEAVAAGLLQIVPAGSTAKIGKGGLKKSVHGKF